ncbi:MAG: hypothetical protein JW923_03245 [Spirochaetales bacterium]|nr:hypothetical protein [Spirochaetales bacterium]MBP7263634.1 streptolysin associated protein SagC [Spirochaetia bacterium]
MKRSFWLEDGVRIFSNGQDELRFRKGIWNFEEATLNLSSLSGALKDTVTHILGELAAERPIDPEDVFKARGLSQDEAATVSSVLDALESQKYLTSSSDAQTRRLVREIIGGTVVDRFTGDLGALKPVLFYADTEYQRDAAMKLAAEIKLPLTCMTDKDAADLAAADLTTKYDALPVNVRMDEFKKIVEPFCCVLVSMARPHVKFLRNLNRVLIELTKPLVLTMMDGPFMTLFTIKPPETGCFECFENRVLARMENLSVYSNFVDQTGGALKVRDTTLTSPILQSMTSTAIFEALMISSIGRAKLAGRVLNIYVPVLEIQMQDLLRVPFCPACGFMAKAEMQEMYASSKRIVDQLIDTVVIEKRVPAGTR